MSRIVGAVDRWQRSHRKVGVTYATFKKFSEDHSTNLASMVAFWAFFSIFPLFLVFVTLLGYVLPAGTKSNVLHHVSSFFPLLDTSTIGSLSGSWWPLAVGGASALWSGMAVMKTSQNAFNAVWEIPEKDRPGLVEQTARSIAGLATIGVGLVVSTIISGFVTGNDTGISLGWAGRAGGFVIAVVLDVALFLLAFRLLTKARVSFRDVMPGALLAGFAFWILQEASSLVIARYLHNAQSTYGNFATVITILWWFYLQAQITLLGAQLNVVLREGLHPRSLAGGPETEGDYRALEAYAQEATYRENEEVEARFSEPERVRR